MADISKITLPSGSTYDIKDAQARADIAAIEQAIAGGVTFMGETTTELTDGATTNPIVINGNNVTALKGYLVVYSSKEFVFDGTHWIEMGDLSVLGNMAYADTASGSYTPAGTVSQPTFSGNELTSTGSYKPEGSVTISKGTGTANYTPEGTVSQPTFSGTAFNSTGNFTPAGSISTGSGTANYTPAGNVSKPDITVTPSTTTVNSITAVGTLPELTTTVANETLTIGFSQGTLPTKGANTSVMTGATAALDDAPAFSGTGVQLKFTGTQGAVSVSGTATGTVSQPTFTGTGAQLKGSFSGTSKAISVTGTPSGTVSQPSFGGTAATITVTPNGT